MNKEKRTVSYFQDVNVHIIPNNDSNESFEQEKDYFIPLKDCVCETAPDKEKFKTLLQNAFERETRSKNSYSALKTVHNKLLLQSFQDELLATYEQDLKKLESTTEDKIEDTIENVANFEDEDEIPKESNALIDMPIDNKIESKKNLRMPTSINNSYSGNSESEKSVPLLASNTSNRTPEEHKENIEMSILNINQKLNNKDVTTKPKYSIVYIHHFIIEQQKQLESNRNNYIWSICFVCALNAVCLFILGSSLYPIFNFIDFALLIVLTMVLFMYCVIQFTNLYFAKVSIMLNLLICDIIYICVWISLCVINQKLMI